MKTNIHFWSYLAQFFLEWEMFQTSFVKKIKKKYFVLSNFSNIVSFMRKCEKNVVEPERPQMTTERKRVGYLRLHTTHTHTRNI